jgi:hypothetical protein
MMAGDRRNQPPSDLSKQTLQTVAAIRQAGPTSVTCLDLPENIVFPGSKMDNESDWIFSLFPLVKSLDRDLKKDSYLSRSVSHSKPLAK